MNLNKSLCASAVGLALASTSAFATNGMNMDGYGPIATGMGGASMAYDNGTAAMMNNPATLGLMADGTQLDVALGWLGPRVTTDPDGAGAFPAANSSATSFLMPAIGYASKNGKLAWAAGVFAQGGMGTEYGPTSSIAGLSGMTNRSEVGVGRAMIAAAYQVNDRMNVGGSLDFIWGGMDLMMDVPIAFLGGLVTGGTMAAALPGMLPGDATYGRFEFSNGSDFSGSAKGYGFGAKLGLTYKVSDTITVGATYHTKTNISDLETSDANMSTDGTGAINMDGSIAVRDFQWPSTYGIGVSVKPSGNLQFALDVKRIMWAGVMDAMRMTFSPGPGQTLDIAMPQNWKNQTVVQGGVSYDVNSKLTLRGGFNFASNPIPNDTVNPLFPATIKKHYTVGIGYKVSDQGALNASFTYAPNVSVTGTGAMNGGAVIDHKQYSGQVMYSHRF